MDWSLETEMMSSLDSSFWKPVPTWPGSGKKEAVD